mmetsp:Transcript_175/g.229  ORF Transcript_175/g.229 Transcript_175/m.229 type:complete len:201 (-) Transcript_175:89-691(-)
MIQQSHLFVGQQFELSVVMIKEISLTIWTSLSNRIQPDIPCNLGSIKMANQTIGQVCRHLRLGQSSYILNSSRTSLIESVHLQKPTICLVHKENQKETQESSQNANVGTCPQVHDDRNGFSKIGVHADANVYEHRDPDEVVCGDFFEACPRPEEKDAPERKFSPQQNGPPSFLDPLQFIKSQCISIRTWGGAVNKAIKHM